MSNQQKDQIRDFGFNELLIGRVYSEWIFSIFKPYMSQSIIEIGCGIGTMLDPYKKTKKIILTDINDEYLKYVKNKYPDLVQIQTIKMDATNVRTDTLQKLKREKITTAISVNVLEHIQEDGKAIRNVYNILQKNGCFLIFVPALPSIYGTIDKEFGHFRRYSKEEIVYKVTQAGFTIEKVKYFNFIGIFWWFITGKILRKKNLPANTGILLKIVVPILQKIEAHIPIPIGQSLIVIARK